MVVERPMGVAPFLKLCWAPLAQKLKPCLYCISSDSKGCPSGLALKMAEVKPGYRISSGVQPRF